jgi:hypothetical protein
MKQLIFLPLLSIGFIQANSPMAGIENSTATHSFQYGDGITEATNTGTQTNEGSSRMAAAVFKSQDYCRVELKDFDFDAHFTITSVTVYFSGAGFKNPEKGMLTSSSLKPVKNLMARCVPGSVIIFDEVKVMGPDNQQRTIQGTTVLLY